MTDSLCGTVSGRVLALVAAGMFLFAPSLAGAALMTLTFDDGAHDETISSPNPELHGPYDWVENNGIRAAGIWWMDVGTPGGTTELGHTHITPNYSGRDDGEYERMHSWTNDLQGLNISLDSGETFDLVSIDYSIKDRNSSHVDFARLPWSTGPEDARLLLSTSAFDPSAADFESQWVSLGIDDLGLPYTPWFTLDVTGFDNLTNFNLSHTISGLAIDTIVIDVHPTVVPEPSAALLIGLGLLGLSRRERC